MVLVFQCLSKFRYTSSYDLFSVFLQLLLVSPVLSRWGVKRGQPIPQCALVGYVPVPPTTMFSTASAFRVSFEMFSPAAGRK